MTREWRSQALCLDLAPAFDNTVEGESTKQREDRLTAAVATCQQCPVRAQCAAEIDPMRDFDVRAGRLLAPESPPRKDKPGVSKLAREHGTQRGFRQHIDRSDMPACRPCKTANRAYESQRRRMAAAS